MASNRLIKRVRGRLVRAYGGRHQTGAPGVVLLETENWRLIDLGEAAELRYHLSRREGSGWEWGRRKGKLRSDELAEFLGQIASHLRL